MKIIKVVLSLEGYRRIDVHKRNESAFQMACEGEYIEVVKLLLDLKGGSRK